MKQQQAMLLLAALVVALLLARGRQTGEQSGPAAPLCSEKTPTRLQLAGDLNHPGIYSTTDKYLTIDVITMAHPRCAEQLDAIVALTQVPIHDGMSVRIVCSGPDGRPALGIGEMRPAQLLTLGIPPDLNRMTADELVFVPGIGPRLAERIVVYRQENGDYETIEQLLQVEGIGEKTVRKLSQYVKVTK